MYPKTANTTNPARKLVQQLIVLVSNASLYHNTKMSRKKKESMRIDEKFKNKISSAFFLYDVYLKRINSFMREHTNLQL